MTLFFVCKFEILSTYFCRCPYTTNTHLARLFRLDEANNRKH